MQISRRLLVSGIGALGLGAGTQVRAAPTPASADAWMPRALEDQFRASIRMRMSVQPEDILWWYTGRIYGQVGNEAPRHLFNLEGTEIYWPIPLEDGSFLVSSRTLTFFRDRESGEMIREYRNPYTNAINIVRPNQLGGRDNSLYSAKGWGYGSDVVSQPTLTPWQIEWNRSGDTLWLVSSRYLSDLPQPWLESMTVFCPVDRFRDPEVTNIPALFSSTYLSPWQGWMDMGDRPGHLVWHSSGRKLDSIDQLPEEYRRRAEAEHGGLLTANPDSWG